MQKDFLFDSKDPKQRGRRCDALYARDVRLKFKWRWPAEYKWIAGKQHEVKKSRTPGQISEVVLKNGWRLEAIFWHTMYEAAVMFRGNRISSHRAEGEDCFVLLTRLDAQLKAEELFEELAHGILNQIRTALRS